MSNLEKKIADQIARECLVVRVRLLNRTITGIYDEALRPLEITAAQLNVLVVIAKRGPISPSAVGRTLNMEKSTVSRNIDRLQKRGWLKVVEGDTGRDHLLELTTEGKKMISKGKPLWDSAQTSAKKILGKNGAKSLREAADLVWSQVAPS